ncbi:MAG: ThiF family adenylyltransferase [Deltaproteobacteria bacterium]|nr:ThiF family adenylyltransferase [Deltaproteobacteria bacterium]
MDRFERQRLLFGEEGQNRIAGAAVGIAGAGGLGAFVALEVAYLGAGSMVIVDTDTLERSNRNREVGAWHTHKDGTPKVEVLRDLIALVDPEIKVVIVQAGLESAPGKEALSRVEVVIGCVDRDGPRLMLNQFCCERGIPLIDAASDTAPAESGALFGGRVCVCTEATGCLVCFGVLDQNEIQEDLATPGQRADREELYGVPKSALAGGGPSVISVNGVIASLAVTELMVLLTGLRKPIAYQDWHGHAGTLCRVTDREMGCYYCGLRPKRGDLDE